MTQNTFKYRSRRAGAVLHRLRYHIAALLLLAAAAFSGIFLIRTALLRNAQDTGTTLAHNYAAEESSDLTVYGTLLSFGASTLEQRLMEGDSAEDIWDWLKIYSYRINATLGAGIIDPYIVLEGRILGANPWEGDSTYDFSTTDWYRRAMETPGTVVFTDVYMDSIYQKPVITASMACGEADAVIAFDIFPENFRFSIDKAALPQGNSFFLCDSNGTIIYRLTELSVPESEIQAYISDVLERINRGELESYDSRIESPDGEQLAVYYSPMDNGWISIVTIPYTNILGNYRWFTLSFALIFGAFFLMFLVMAWRDALTGARMERTNETVRVLGNSYYALYRINYAQNTYEMIKGSDYMRSHIPPSGEYEELLRASGGVIEPDAYHDFLKTFSAENIRQLVRRRVRDFGGDFLRLFGDTYRWVSVRLLFDESLSPEEVVLCFRDVDDEKAHQLEERRLLQDALETSRKNEAAKQTFFSNMSHDMRTPLNAIIGLSRLAEEHFEQPGKAREYLRKINASSRQLLDLISDILDMSRMEQGDFQLNNQPVNLEECVSECLETFRIQAADEGKDFSSSLRLKEPMVLTDPLRIRQILNNLLSNALKFTVRGDSIRVELTQLDQGDFAKYKLTVSDTGAGMAEDFLPQLFEPYQRERRFRANQTIGTGLGMPIVKSLVTQMSGEIFVESQEDKGTTFTLVLPLCAPHQGEEAPEADGAAPAGGSASADGPTAAGDSAPAGGSVSAGGPTAAGDSAQAGGSVSAGGPTAAGDSAPVDTPVSDGAVILTAAEAAVAASDSCQAESTAPADSGSGQTGQTAPSFSLEGRRILLAEDNEVNMEIATELLALYGVTVTPAWNGREALERFRDSEPGFFDAILMDLQMPEMDGCEAARRIRSLSRPDAGTVPILAVTANAFAEDIAATTAAGMNAHISKPIDFTLLCQTLEKLIG